MAGFSEVLVKREEGADCGAPDLTYLGIPHVKDKNVNRKHCCKYCLKLVGNFERHVKDLHSSEEDIINMLATTDTKIKKKMKRKIMVEEEAIHNRVNPENKILRKRSSSEELIEQCFHCKAVMRSEHIPGHVRICSMNECEILGGVEMCERLKKEILPPMQTGNVKDLCAKDKALILYGNSLCMQWPRSHDRALIRGYLRIAARVVLRAMMIDDAVMDASSLFHMAAYESFERAVEDVCRDNQGDGKSQASKASQYGPKVLQVALALLEELNQLKDSVEAYEKRQELKGKIADLKGWLRLYNEDLGNQGRKQASVASEAVSGDQLSVEGMTEDAADSFITNDPDVKPSTSPCRESASSSYCPRATPKNRKPLNYSDSEDDRSSAFSCTSPGLTRHRKYAPKKPWSDKEIGAIKEYFGSQIFKPKQKLPSLNECCVAIGKFPCLKDRSAPQLKTFIHNRQKTGGRTGRIKRKKNFRRT